jgi:hypothetical protein
MACINISSPQYRKLQKEAEQTWKSKLDLYIDVSSFNNYFDRFPNSLSELDKGLEFINYKNYMSDDIARIVMINSPAIERVKPNRYEFKVVAGSTKLDTRGKLYETAKRLAEQVNNEFVNSNQKDIARVTDESGIVSLIIEPNSEVINSYMETSYRKAAQDRMEYEEELKDNEDISDFQAEMKFNEMLESGEINQTCKI